MSERSTAALAGGIVAAAIVLGHRGGAARRAMGGSVGEYIVVVDDPTEGAPRETPAHSRAEAIEEARAEARYWRGHGFRVRGDATRGYEVSHSSWLPSHQIIRIRIRAQRA